MPLAGQLLTSCNSTDAAMLRYDEIVTVPDQRSVPSLKARYGMALGLRIDP
jgi:hypothetical protein